MNTDDSRLLSGLIQEFLHFHDFGSTLNCFEAELQKKRLTGAPHEARSGEAVGQFITSLNMGDRSSFFSLWERHLPPKLRHHDRTALKLEFYANIYFAIHPLLSPTTSSNALASMTSFKTYIESKGSDLSKTPEFLPYYALPFVPNPQEHPSFYELFRPDWLEDLRTRIRTFLETSLPPVRKPKIYGLVEDDRGGKGDGCESRVSSGHSDDGGASERLREKIDELERALAEARRHRRVVNQFSHDLLQLAADAVTSLNEVCNGARMSHSDVSAMGERLQKFEDSLPLVVTSSKGMDGTSSRISPLDDAGDVPVLESVESPTFHRTRTVGLASSSNFSTGEGGRGYDNSGGRASGAVTGGVSGLGSVSLNNIEESLRADSEHLTVVMNSQSMSFGPGQLRDAGVTGVTGVTGGSGGTSVPAFAALDYAKVKHDLASDNPDTVAALLQALRWRLAFSKDSAARRVVVHTYIQGDLLECDCDSEDSPGRKGNPDFLVSLVRHVSPLVREETARLVNTLASDVVGRSYVLHHPVVVRELVLSAQREKSDSATRQNVLGALQKFSLRRKPQNIMIEMDVIKWLCTQLRATTTLSLYTLEYGTALLMNLCLRTAGKVKCEDKDCDIIGILKALLRCDVPGLRAYVHGALYSVLTRPVIREQAVEAGLGDILSSLHKGSEEPFQRQIEFIVDQLHSNEPSKDVSDDEGDDDEEEEDEIGGDDTEPLLDDDDAHVFKGSTGEELLCRRYLTSSSRAGKEAHDIRQSISSRDAALRMSRASMGVNEQSILQSPRLGNVDISIGKPLQRAVTPKNVSRSVAVPAVTSHPDIEIDMAQSQDLGDNTMDTAVDENGSPHLAARPPTAELEADPFRPRPRLTYSRGASERSVTSQRTQNRSPVPQSNSPSPHPTPGSHTSHPQRSMPPSGNHQGVSPTGRSHPQGVSPTGRSHHQGVSPTGRVSRNVDARSDVNSKGSRTPPAGHAAPAQKRSSPAPSSAVPSGTRSAAPSPIPSAAASQGPDEGAGAMNDGSSGAGHSGQMHYSVLDQTLDSLSQTDVFGSKPLIRLHTPETDSRIQLLQEQRKREEAVKPAKAESEQKSKPPPRKLGPQARLSQQRMQARKTAVESKPSKPVKSGVSRARESTTGAAAGGGVPKAPRPAKH